MCKLSKGFREFNCLMGKCYVVMEVIISRILSSLVAEVGSMMNEVGGCQKRRHDFMDKALASHLPLSDFSGDISQVIESNF